MDSRNGPHSPLSLLPTELLRLIVHLCDSQRDVAAWAGTNRHYNAIIGHLLYENAVAQQQWSVVYWAAERGRVGTLRQWLSVGDPDGSVCRSFDVYQFVQARTLQRTQYVMGPLSPATPIHRFQCNAPLHLAASSGHADAVAFLLDHGADVDAPSLDVTPHGLSVFRDGRDGPHFLDDRCVTPAALHIAIIAGHADVAALLLRRGARLPVTTLRGRRDGGGGGGGGNDNAGRLPHGVTTAVHLAAAFGMPDILRALARRPDVDLDAPDAYGQPPLLYAAELSRSPSPGSGSGSGSGQGLDLDLDTMDVLKELGADVDVVVRSPDTSDAPLLQMLILGIRWRAAARLVELGARVDEGLLKTCELARESVIHPNVADFDAWQDLVTRIQRRLPRKEGGLENGTGPRKSSGLKRMFKFTRS